MSCLRDDHRTTDEHATGARFSLPGPALSPWECFCSASLLTPTVVLSPILSLL